VHRHEQQQRTGQTAPMQKQPSQPECFEVACEDDDEEHEGESDERDSQASPHQAMEEITMDAPQQPSESLPKRQRWKELD